MKVDLDKFYTPISIAKKCISQINLNEYDTIIEPSAGNGSFSNLLNCIAYDIEPESEKIIKQDFFTISKIEGKHILFIGNPPFGKRSALAKLFIKHCIELNAETIAFILPNTFNKYSMQNVFPFEWKLKNILSLDCEYIADKINYFVPSSFFVWTKKDCDDLRKKPPKENNDFIFLSRGSREADFTLNGNNGKVKKIEEVTNPKSEHYIKVTNPSKIEEIKRNLSNIIWKFYSSVNGGVSWLNQKDIIEQYGELYC